MRVKDIMSTTVITVRSDLDADAAWQAMRDARVHHLVVVDDGRIVGILSDRDLGGPHGTSVRANQRVAALMSAYVVVASPGMKVRDAANLMRGNTFSALPVVQDRELVGVVTTSDLVALVGKS